MPKFPLSWSPNGLVVCKNRILGIGQSHWDHQEQSPQFALLIACHRVYVFWLDKMIHAHGHTQAADSTVLPGDGGEDLVVLEALKDHLGLGSGFMSWTLPRSQCDQHVVPIL